MWRTEAPLGTDRTKEHLKLLSRMQRATEDIDHGDPPSSIFIETMVVYVDGVKWEWERR